jgi:hypothetical protein
MSGQLGDPAALPLKKKVPVGQEAGWVPEPIWTRWQREKSLPLVGTKSQSSCPQPTLYTECATFFPNSYINKFKYRAPTSPSPQFKG